MKTFLLLLLMSVPAFAQTLSVNLAGTGVTSHSVSLAWNASPTAGVDHYGVYRSIVSGSGYALMGKVPASQLWFVNGSNPDGTPLVSGTTYYYVVVAFQGTAFSPDSNETSATVPVSPAPATGLTSTVH